MGPDNGLEKQMFWTSIYFWLSVGTHDDAIIQHTKMTQNQDYSHDNISDEHLDVAMRILSLFFTSTVLVWRQFIPLNTWSFS